MQVFGHGRRFARAASAAARAEAAEGGEAAAFRRADMERFRADMEKSRTDTERFRTDAEKFRADMAQRESNRMQWLIGIWIGGVLVTIAVLGMFIRLAI